MRGDPVGMAADLIVLLKHLGAWFRLFVQSWFRWLLVGAVPPLA